MTLSNADISAAVTSAKGDAGATTETPAPETTTAPAKETAAAEAPAKEQPKASSQADGSADDDEEFYNPTAEELATIEASPELKKAYRALRKGFTAKTTELARIRKEAQESISLAQWIESNPEQAARALAQHTGLTIGEAREQIREAGSTGDVIDELEAEWTKTVGPDAARLLRPLVEKTLNKALSKTIDPLRAQTEQLAEASARRGIASALSQFGADVTSRGDEWTDDIQRDMADVVNRIEPAENTTIDEFLALVYDKVMYQRVRNASNRDKIARLKRIREDSGEPAAPTRSGGAESERVTSGMKDNDAVALAVKLARKDVSSRR